MSQTSKQQQLFGVAITDPDPLARKIFRDAVENNGNAQFITIIWDAATYEDTITEIKRLPPDILIVGSTTCDLRLLHFVEHVAVQFHGINLLLLTPAPESMDVSCGLLKCGIRGHLPREDTSVVPDAVTTILWGGSWFSNDIWSHLKNLLSQVQKQESLLMAHRFTGRESEVFGLLMGGYSNAEIARSLNLSQRTVRDHLGHVCEKLEVASPLMAVLKVYGKIDRERV